MLTCNILNGELKGGKEFNGSGGRGMLSPMLHSYRSICCMPWTDSPMKYCPRLGYEGEESMWACPILDYSHLPLNEKNFDPSHKIILPHPNQ